MDEYISRKATLDVIREVSEHYADENLAEFAYNIVINIPATDVQPIVYAHKTINVGRRSYCSNCGKLAIMEDFCSKCGARVENGDTE